MGAFADELSHDARQRSVHHLHHHAFRDERTGVELQVALDELAETVDLSRWNRGGLAGDRHDVDHAWTFEDRQTRLEVEAGKAIPGKQRPVDPLFAVLPPAPLRDRGQEGLDL